MSYIQFESASDKNKARQELREAGADLLEQAIRRADACTEREMRLELNGEKNWMLPALAKKLENSNKQIAKTTSKRKEDKKKNKKIKKSEEKHRKHRYSSSSEIQTGPDENVTKSSSGGSGDEDGFAIRKKKHSKKSKNKRKNKSKHKKNGSSSNSDDSDEVNDKKTTWVERGAPQSDLIEKSIVQRDDWMMDSSALMLKTYTRERNEPKKPNEKGEQEINVYDPAQSKLELNPYWKSRGTGLPSFQKPQSDDNSDNEPRLRKASNPTLATTTAHIARGWQKKSTLASDSGSTTKTSKRQAKDSSTSSSSEDERHDIKEQTVGTTKPSTSEFLTDQQMNQLAAKALKAEIKGDKQLATELHTKLENARKIRAAFKASGKPKATRLTVENSNERHVLLTHTDACGNARPLRQSAVIAVPTVDPRELYGGRRAKTNKKRVKTHVDGERVRYFPDDDRYDIKQMFEHEKYTSASDSNLQFAEIGNKHKNPNDDLDDIFADNVRRQVSKADADKKEVQHAIHQHERLSTQLENCERCFESAKLDKRLIVSMGEKVYLAMPWHVGLQLGHCVLLPTQHVTCVTQLDEDSWEELSNFRKALTRMFAAQHKDVIFYEIANKLHRCPHLSIHCIPIPESKGEMAPFYFKKAIEESELEWCVNKQLVSLRQKSLRAAIPKGLPYFWVNFGMDNGFAHVIEDQERFPSNFAQEIIGGMLELNPSAWRRPQKEQNVIAKVKRFADWWQKYDCTQQ